MTALNTKTSVSLTLMFLISVSVTDTTAASSTGTTNVTVTTVDTTTYVATSPPPSPSTTKAPLSCFSCVATSENDPCWKDRATMANILTRDQYVKNCSLWETRCMTLLSTVGGKLDYYQRDCHDGVYFPPFLSSPLFLNVTSDNKSHCDVKNTSVGKDSICYTACGKDLCNGPKSDECAISGLNSSSCPARPPLQCYDCAASVGSEDCVTDISGMLNTSLGRNNNYLKNCSATMNRCMIIFREINGNINYYQRDCHDGQFFAPDIYSPIFANLPPDNQSYCGLVGGAIVCYRSCDSNFCNGPQKNECDQYKFDGENIPEDSPCRATQSNVTNIQIMAALLCLMLTFLD